MLSKKNKKLTLVLYKDQSAPQTYQVSKTKYKLFFIIIPIIVLISVLTSAILITYFNEINRQIVSKKPEQIKAFEKQVVELNETIQANKSQINELVKKLSSTSVDSLDILPVFNKTAGFQDLTAEKNIIEISNTDLKINNNKILINFDIVNAKSTGEKLAGHIYVALKMNNAIYFYPGLNSQISENLALFNEGEPFAITRFRSVNASFPRFDKSPQRLHFTILIFSKAGDLYYKNTFGPYSNSMSEG